MIEYYYMATSSYEYMLRREDLESLSGISPIMSCFVARKRQHLYLHNDQWAILPDTGPVIGFDAWIEKEAAFCKESFKP